MEHWVAEGFIAHRLFTSCPDLMYKPSLRYSLRISHDSSIKADRPPGE